MNPHRKIRSSPALDRTWSGPLRGGLTVAAVLLIPLVAIGGGDRFRAALDFTTGVLSLVALTASVGWGLLATDRLFLSTRHRLLAQAVHRATAVASLGFLLLHGTVKVSLGHVRPLGALVPFGLGVDGAAGLIGLGSLAGLLMVVAATTGALRSALAGRGRIAARWRPLHMLAYPAWCAALVHGLYAGRPPAGWVVALYCLALAGVAGAVSLRLLPPPLKRRVAARIAALAAPGPQGPPTPPEAAEPLAGAPQGLSGVIPAQRRPEPDPVPPSRPLAPPVGQGRGTALPPVAPPRPDAGVPYRGPAPGPSGFSAAYRAVSLGGTAAPYPPPGPQDPQEAPLAERVPMTEELPVVPGPAHRAGHWPTPSPLPPAQSPSYARPPAGEPWNPPAGERP
ncbi:hypothetical protein ABT160_00475 [Streptomyces sp. NPDC001941]|uniref:hypothetical protein n=1 Tax=Streptomyces sp. NPDC001941 TaxID=3154659 RepID=UPI00332E7E95